ncbi:STAS domain-containing protein [Streptomyces sp. NPDC032472]|uniref:STAS domain-containing protein n=1 Tax=Streptomyces sp. NPDC032472 TaxID=3155018 RepID=UPI0033D1476C
MLNKDEHPAAAPGGTPTGQYGAATCRTSTDGVSVITLVADFDADNAKELTFAFEKAARAGSKAVVDCTGITFAGLSLLHALIEAAHSDLVLAGPLPHPLTALLDATQNTSAFTHHRHPGGSPPGWVGPRSA